MWLGFHGDPNTRGGVAHKPSMCCFDIRMRSPPSPHLLIVFSFNNAIRDPSQHDRVAGLAQERIYSPDQQQYWLNLLLLLFAGAEACDRALREKVGRAAASGSGRCTACSRTGEGRGQAPTWEGSVRHTCNATGWQRACVRPRGRR